MYNDLTSTEIIIQITGDMLINSTENEGHIKLQKPNQKRRKESLFKRDNYWTMQ